VSARTVVFPVLNEPNTFIFGCDGSGCAHGNDARWTFDGDLVNPTISPSVLSEGEKRCHFFVKKGRIQYLNDSQHELAGQTVDMTPPPWKDE
jgi:hypothetical protein